MAFPSNPSDGDTYIRYGRTYEYEAALSMWKVLKSGIQLTELSDVDTTTTTPVAGDALVWSGTKFEPDNINLLSVYQSELPLSGNVSGQMAYVTDTSRLYIYTGAGWFNVALVNTNPTITVGPDGSYVFATDGTPIVLTLEAQDPEELPIAWSYTITSGALGSTATVQQEGNVFTITPSTDRNDTGEFSITFTASDGVNLATAVSTFTLVFAADDQYYNSTSLLVKSGSTAGLNNTTFVDGSTNDFTVTSGGDVYQGSLSPYSPAGWSAYFDGTGDYLAVPSSTQFGFGTGDFTWDMWVFPTASPTNGPGTLLEFRTAATASATTLRITSSLHVIYYDGPADIVTTFTSQTVALNTWSHIAIVRSGNTVFGYINGLLAGSAAVSSNLGSNQPLWIGQNRSAGYNFNGYISNLRVVKGTAVYTTAFTPPTEPLTAIAGTSLLTCQSNRFIDNSTNNFTITRTGDAKPVPFSPYLPLEQYDPTVHGGSAYLDGTGDYLSLSQQTALSFGTGDFTVEAWVYPTANPTTFWSIMDARGSATTVPWVAGLRLISGNLKLEFYTGTQIQGSITVPLNTWTHVAFSRSGTAFKGFVNGVVDINTTMSTNLNIAAGTQVIGSIVDPTYNTGYITDVRIVKGTAVYTADFTPPTQRLTAISGTSLLLNMNNAGIYDEMGKHNIKLIGNATTSTTQTKYNDTAMYFDGTGDYITGEASPSYGYGTSDFTIEFWMYLVGTSTRTVVSNLSSASGTQPHIYTNGTDLRFYTTGSDRIASGSLNANQWYHVSLCRGSSSTRLFIDGAQVGSTYADTNNYGSSAPLGIGTYHNPTPVTTSTMSGYIEDLRITKGVARYTTGFTPPTAPLGFYNAE